MVSSYDTRQYITETDFSGLRLMGAKGRPAIDCWEELSFYVQQNAGAPASLLAEPEALGDGRYTWFTALTGDVVPFSGLSNVDQSVLLQRASEQLSNISILANTAKNHNDRQIKLIGDMLLAAITVSPDRLESSLYSVGGWPVLVNWGARIDSPEHQNDGPLVISTITIPQEEPRKLNLALFAGGLLWVLFTLVCTAIFYHLIDGCGSFGITLSKPLGYCSAEFKPSKPLLDAQAQNAQLQTELLTLQNQVIDGLYCSNSNNKGIVNSPSDEIDSSGAGSETASTPSRAGKQAIADQVSLNESLQAVGASVCNGMEVIATWQEPVDIDLRLYYLGPTEAVASSTGEEGDLPLVDAYNPETEFAIWDIGSSGDEKYNPFIERVCIDNPDITGDFFASVFHDGSPGEAISVQLVARGGGIFEQVALDVSPQQESELGLPLTLVE